MQYVKRFHLVMLGSLIGASLHARAFKSDLIDSYFADYNHPDRPGASVLVMKQGKILYERGYGSRELVHYEPVNERTNFRLASVSKQFTATAILLLVQRGQLSLDTFLVSVFPDFPSYGSKITVRHLLNHTSGLTDYEDLIPSTQVQQLTDQDVLNLLKKQNGLYFSPGSQYRYSNGGYVLLGLIVESLSGQNFAEFLEENIFRPLQMNYSVMYDGPSTEIENRAYGHSLLGNGFKQTDQNITSATRGDGGIYSSAHDWVRWETAISENLILSQKYQEMVFTPGKLNNGTLIDYGFGWMLNTFQGLVHQYHTGSTIGFRTSVERFPDKELVVLVLVNRANASPWVTARNIAEQLF